MVAEELYQLKRAAVAFSKTIASAVIAEQTPALDKISMRHAYKIYGRGWIDKHVAAGDLNTSRAGKAKNSPKQLSRLECNALLESEQSLTF